jgi:hypothetical protein
MKVRTIVMFDKEFDFNTDFDFDDVATEDFDDAFVESDEFDVSDDDLPDISDEEFADDLEDDPIFEGAQEDINDELSPAAEAAIFMDVLRESFDSDAEFVDYVQENAVEWELYGLIPSASRALEATKVLKVTDWKAKNRQRLIRRECIRLACKNKDSNYAKYKKYRDLMREYRQKIFDRYENKAKSNVMKSMSNSKAKASNIKTSSGVDVKKRVDNAKITSEKGKDPTNAPKNSKAS